MLTAYRRHVKNCPHRALGRKYRRCRCPIWVDGFLQGVELRESLNLKDWDKAQDRIREWEARGMVVAEEEPPLSLSEAQERFRADAEARGLRPATLAKYRGLFTQMQAFARDEGRPFLEQWTLEALRRFRQSWTDGGMSALKKLERLRAFFRFAHESKWIEENPTKAIENPKVTTPPTLPFTQEEMIAILAACGRYPDNYGKLEQINAQRLKALVLLLRYSGMRIGDAVTCAQDRLTGDRLFLYTQKTGVPVRVKLPAFVAESLRSVPSMRQQFFFWSGEGRPVTANGNWRRAMRKLFKLATVADGHPHRFRDTFATELLLAGVPLDRVSVLLGHSSIRVTENHYSPWVRARQEQLEADLERSWERDPVVLAEKKGTPQVHGGSSSVN